MTTKKDSTDPRSFMTEENLNCIRKLRLIDDDFMCICFSDAKCVEYVLRVIMNKPDLTVNKVHVQHEIKKLKARSVCLDIYATDKNGKRYNIEIQRDDGGAIAKRARYHAAMMDYTGLKKKEKFEKLRETYIIFITENDIFGEGKPLYTIDRQIKETGKPFDDGLHIVYVNGAARDVSTELGRLMYDMFCVKAEDMYSKILSERVGYFKSEQEGVSGMCKELEEMKKRAEERGEKRGEKRGEERGRREAHLEMIVKYINKCKAGGKAEDVIISDLEEYFDYSDADARAVYEKYAG